MTLLRVVVAALALPASLLLNAGCGAPPDLTRRIPADSEWAVKLPSLDAMHMHLGPLAQSVGGDEALAKWLDAHTGIVPGATSSEDTAGVDPEQPLVAFGRNGVRFLVIPTSAEGALDRTIRDRRMARGAMGDGETTGMAWVHGDGFTLLGWGDPDGLEEALERVAGAAPGAARMGTSEPGEAIGLSARRPTGAS